jgi:spermidine synthase
VTRAARLLLLAAFLLSGASTLVYEILWIKHLVYLFGVTYHAITTVVTVFMAGLAIGAVVAGRRIDRARSPLLVYALLEVFIAVCGLGFPLALAGVTGLYHRVHDVADVGFFAHTLVRFGLGCVLLLPPTIAMGATLPVLSRFFVHRQDRIGRDVGWLYGVNTLGAAVGCALTGFVLMTSLGLAASARVAVAMNLLAAATAGLLWLLPIGRTGSLAEAAPPPVSSGSSRWLLVAFFLSGFSATAIEILWTRIVALLHPNAHTLVFALVLTLFLVGTGLGSALYAGPLDRIRPLRLYGALQIGLGLLTAGTPFHLFWQRSAQRETWTTPSLLGRTSLDLYITQGELLVVALALGGAGLLFGMTFPIGNRLYVRRLSVLGAGVGAVYFVSTVGGIAGSFVAGFFAMPALGAKNALFAVAGINLGLGVVLLAAPARRWLLAGGLTAAAAGGLVVLAGMMQPWAFLNIPVKHRVEFYKDGRSTTDAVVWVDQRGSWEQMLFANGEFVSSGPIGTWLATLLHPEPADVLILAFDTGATSGQVVAHPDVRAVEAADISDVQPIIAEYFERENRGVMRHPRFTMVPNDGRNHLLTRRKQYDIIFNGVAAYSAYLELSTAEFFEICRERLDDDGLYLHKIHPHMMTPDGFRRVIATFAEVFPTATLWRSRVSSVLLLVGWKRETTQDWAAFEARVAAQGQGVPAEVAAMYLGGTAELIAYSAGFAPLVDDRPPRLVDTLTLIDTGSDFLMMGPMVNQHGTSEREIQASLRQLGAPTPFFTGVPAETRAEVDALRAREHIAHPVERAGGGPD